MARNRTFFFNQFSHDEIEELISDDDLFRIALLSPELDYQ